MHYIYLCYWSSTNIRKSSSSSTPSSSSSSTPSTETPFTIWTFGQPFGCPKAHLRHGEFCKSFTVIF